MKNLTKNSVANVAKVGVASALIGAGLFLSACGGGDEFKPSSDTEKAEFALVKAKYPDAKFLSYEVAKKELGSTSSRNFKECLKSNTYFAKLPNGEIKISKVYVLDSGDFEVEEVSFKDLKRRMIACFED